MDTSESIEATLSEKLQAASVSVEDESWRHRGHAGAASGGGHFIVKVVSSEFSGKSLVERHQMVYRALGDLMPSIHALSIQALTPDQQ